MCLFTYMPLLSVSLTHIQGVSTLRTCNVHTKVQTIKISPPEGTDSTGTRQREQVLSARAGEKTEPISQRKRRNMASEWRQEGTGPVSGDRGGNRVSQWRQERTGPVSGDRRENMARIGLISGERNMNKVS